jgi:hypothetical protein
VLEPICTYSINPVATNWKQVKFSHYLLIPWREIYNTVGNEVEIKRSFFVCGESDIKEWQIWTSNLVVTNRIVASCSWLEVLWKTARNPHNHDLYSHLQATYTLWNHLWVLNSTLSWWHNLALKMLRKEKCHLYQVASSGPSLTVASSYERRRLWDPSNILPYNGWKLLC